jgi:NADPH2:quinone reductase
LYPLPHDPPICPGLEASGEIIGLGKNVNNFNIGDKVCYASTPLGAYCEIRDYPSEKIVKIPSFMSTDDAASIFLQGMTVEYLFERLYKLKKNEIFLFHAAAGGVGLIACQWAKSLGARMIGTVSTKEKSELAKNNGCEFIINYKEQDVLSEVMRITNNEGVPVVYDGVGKDTFETSLSCLRIRGLMVSFGQSSGMVEKVDLHKTFNPNSLYFTRPTLMHYNLTREEFELSSKTLFDKIEKGEINTNISEKFNLKDASKAHTKLQSRNTTGSILLIP